MHADATSYTVIDHLLDRLTALGVEKLFGVPGDYTLPMLDHIVEHPDASWIGCATELGAAYAADGYARVRGLGVVCTTFGVGELSAINGIAGSYAERVPVIHIVGAPSLATQRSGRPTHHTLGDGDFRHFQRMHAEVTCVQASLTLENAAPEIDHVIREVLERRLPGYLVIPVDVGLAEIDPAAHPLQRHLDATSVRALRRFEQAARPMVQEARRPAVLADILVGRFGAREALHELLATGLPHASLLWGRRVVDESAPNFVGTYVGAASREGVRAVVEDADLLVQAGVQFTDLTSGFFSQDLADDAGIVVDGTTSIVGGRTFGPIAMADALRVLRKLFDERRDPLPVRTDERPPVFPPSAEATNELTQAGLWETVSAWLQSGDLVLADQGTAFYGMGAHRLPHDVLMMGQPLWASIGFTLPAVLGAALAAPKRRPVLLIGDGAAQMTVAELGTLVRNGIPAIVVLVDNGGYTVERAIHGAAAEYNDIAPWDWAALSIALGASGVDRADTVAGLRAALHRAREAETGVSVVVAEVPSDDVPPLLAAIATAAARANDSR
ncbi:thiamine pyrophosphate-binding protein [Curtobacterium sp. MCPF17_002]|uniref:alpha-keto acid decarboxylase family protein n=1 Tax=Curtobacterium sp. MCPF17_002 TaxID=2175645 RepID=UPI000DA74EF7|nr:thiamine pyrophosphate-binding protein [Curtobacterium sp. MCPF17_002]WIB77002.1 thiamine pyrophosphate-binding protein [Curtobacterium sp. MCPF17_002]